MEQPRLKIHDHEVGLREIEHGLYEPKSIKILLDCLTDSLDVRAPSFYVINEPPEECETYKKIRSFCFTTSYNRISEAKILLKSLRQHHSQPIYIHCDWCSQLAIERLGYENLIIKPVINEKYLKNIVKTQTKNKYQILEQMHHCRSDYIFAKLECLKQAMMKFKNTFFLDTDIVVLDDLQENFTERLCLSPAFFTPQLMHQGFEYGFYNAGYLFCEDRGFPQYWIDRFLDDSSFYEQECMNRFRNVYEFQTFSESHNFGFWRGEAEVETPKSLHVHITDEIKNEVKGSREEAHFTNFRAKSLQIIKQKNPDLYSYINQLGNYKKLAFLHMAKCGGTYVRTYLHNTVIAPFIDHVPEGKNERENPHLEFNPNQISEVIDEVDKTDLTETQWMRFHQNSVDLKTIKKLNDFGWETFTFLRDPRDLICSLYFFCRRKVCNGSRTSRTNFLVMAPWSGIAGHKDDSEWDINDIDTRKMSLNDFFIEVIKNEKLHIFWKLPEYIESVKYIDEMSHDNLGKFINKVIDPGHIYRPISVGKNSSDNTGYEFYCSNGDISKEAQRLIDGHPEYIKYQRYLDLGKR